MKYNFKLEEIKYAKILYEDSSGKTFTIKSVVKQLDNTGVSMYIKYDEKVLQNLDKQVVGLKFVCSDGLYSSKAKISKIESIPPYIVIKLENLDNIIHNQNREFFRVPVNIDCTCIRQNDNEIEKISGEILDLSANGVKVVFNKVFRINGTESLSFFIENKELLLKLRYIRSSVVENKFIISFNFYKIDESTKNLISQFCIRKQLEEKRKHLI